MRRERLCCTSVLLTLVCLCITAVSASPWWPDLKLPSTVSSSAFPVAAFEPQNKTYAVGWQLLFGSSNGGVGDLNDDGFEEFAFAATQATPLGTSKTKAGVIFVVWGRLAWSAAWPLISSFPNSSLGMVIQGSVSGQRIGYGMSGGQCDFNNDGIDDMLFSCAPATAANGAVFVLYGRPKSASWPAVLAIDEILADSSVGFKVAVDPSATSQWSNYFGFKSPSCADFNGDGHPDILFGDHVVSGAALVLAPSSSSWPSITTVSSLSSASFNGILFTGPSYLGAQTTTVDLNLDGHSDLVITSSMAESGRGSVHVIWGGSINFTLSPTVNMSLPVTALSQGLQFKGVVVNDMLGTDVTSGDLNGDNHNDLVIASTHYIYLVISSASTVWQSTMTPTLMLLRDYGGSASLAAGDVNNDGIDDVIVGTPTGNGFLFIIFGRSDGLWSFNLSASSVPNGINWSRLSVSVTTVTSQLGFAVGLVHGNRDKSVLSKVVCAAHGIESIGVGYLVSGPACQRYNTNNVCASCYSGFGLSGGTCTPCIPKTTFSDGTTPCTPTATATACKSFSQAGSCLDCSTPGVELSYSGECLWCTGNTWSNGTTSCVPGVSTNCMECNHTTGDCVRCHAGFGLSSSGLCHGCSSPTTWSVAGNSTCKVCSVGVGGSQCVECATTSGKCMRCSSSDFILANGTCTQQYQLVINGPTALNITQLIVEISQVLGVEPTQVQVTIQINSDTGKIIAVVLLPDNIINVETILSNQQTTTTKWLRYIETVKRLRSVDTADTNNATPTTSISCITLLFLLFTAFLFI